MPPASPGAPLTPGMSSWAIVSHPGSLWVIFDPSGVSNWGVSLLCIAVHCSALQCNFALFAFFVFFVLFFYFFCMIWFHTIILMPNKYKNHLFIAKTNKWILAPFISIHTTPCHINLYYEITFHNKPNKNQAHRLWNKLLETCGKSQVSRYVKNKPVVVSWSHLTKTKTQHSSSNNEWYMIT